MIPFAESVRVIRASPRCQVSNCGELTAAVLACIFRLLTSFIEDVIPFTETVGMVGAGTGDQVPHTGEIPSAINAIKSRHIVGVVYSLAKIISQTAKVWQPL